jgi:iron complex transport system substrate-binding protein
MELRIVSLIASATEIACALGFEKRLVGRSHECDFPESVKTLPACTAPRLDPRKGSADIDRDVKALLGSALGIYQVDADLLRSLRPTHILTQVQCEVCAVSLKDVERALAAWTRPDPTAPGAQVISLEASALEGVFADVMKVAAALDAPERGRGLVERLRARMEAVRATARALEAKPPVAVIEWIEPLMAAGNWTPELVEMAGGVNLFGAAGKHSPGLSWDELASADPEAMLVAPCGFDIPRTLAEMPALAKRPGWKKLRAVAGNRVFLGDGNQFFNRPGPRLVESLEILAEVLHPGVFRFGQEGKGWIRF